MLTDENVQEKRKQVADLIFGYYKKTGEIMSISAIEKKTGINRMTLYVIFPGGQREMCTQAGIPLTVPMPHAVPKSIQPENQQLQSPKTTDIITPRDVTYLRPINSSTANSREEISSGVRLMLTPSVWMRLLGIAHWEGLADPLQVISMLIEQDARRRKEFPSLSVQDILKVYYLLALARKRGWSDDQLLNVLATIYDLKLDQLTPTEMFALLQQLEEALSRHWDLRLYAQEVSRQHSLAWVYAEWLRGNISADKAIRGILEALERQ